MGTRHNNAVWETRCDCGGTKEVLRQNLLRTRSCGCLHSETTTTRNRARATHGHSRPRSPEYLSWTAMRGRCLNPRNPAYESYGGRGITICERWNSFENFLDDMGPRLKAESIDRIDSDKGYYPENCRWADWVTQNDSRRKRKRKP